MNYTLKRSHAHACFVLLTFQLQHGISIAIRNTPSSGPDVAEVTNIDDSITPDKRLTKKLIPMITNPYITPIVLIA